MAAIKSANTYEQLRELLEMPQYQARDEETLLQLARQQANAQYGAQAQTAKQQYDQTDLSLQSQLAALLADAMGRKQEAAANTSQALRNQQLSALQRGMQRSSYNQAAQAGIESQGILTQDQIARDVSQSTADTESKRQLLAQQLAQTLARLEMEKESNVTTAVQKMKDQDYDRALEALKIRNQLSQWLAGNSAAW